jgi:tetratricopeptide (TPR) repeat protein
MKYFEMSEKFRIEEDRANLGATLIEKSEVLLKQNLIDDVIEKLELGLKYSDEYKNLEYLLKGNLLLADVYDKIDDNKKLEKVYLKITEILKTTENKCELKYIYNKLALMYLKQAKENLCEKYLLLAINLI